MTDVWRLLVTPHVEGAWNMGLDEAMMDAVGNGDSPPTLRLYGWQPPCLSLGYAQPYSDIDPERLVRHGWDVVRRPTGGRAILHTEELTYAVIASVDEPLVAGGVLESYGRIAGALLSAMQKFELPVEMKILTRIEGKKKNPVCFEVPSACEIMVHGRKLIGSAQARRKDSVLQHGSIPLAGDLRRIVNVLSFNNNEARAQAAQRLEESATTVEQILGKPVSWDCMAQALVESFTSIHHLEFHEGTLTPFEQARAMDLVEKKYAHSSWLKRV
jgi:lipoate-protein ligase A